MALRSHDLAKDLPTVAATLATEEGRDELLTAKSTAPSATAVTSSSGLPTGEAPFAGGGGSPSSALRFTKERAGEALGSSRVERTDGAFVRGWRKCLPLARQGREGVTDAPLPCRNGS